MAAKQKVCPVCDYINSQGASQCHHCSTQFDSRNTFQRIVYKLRVFKRLNDLDLKNKKLYAALAKVCKELESFNP